MNILKLANSFVKLSINSSLIDEFEKYLENSGPFMDNLLALVAEYRETPSRDILQKFPKALAKTSIVLENAAFAEDPANEDYIEMSIDLDRFREKFDEMLHQYDRKKFYHDDPNYRLGGSWGPKKLPY